MIQLIKEIDPILVVVVGYALGSILLYDAIKKTKRNE